MGLERFLQIFRPKDSIRQSDAASALLETEIEQCLSYFERTESETRDRVIEEARKNGTLPAVIPEFLKGPVRLKSIHGRKYTVGRLGKGYFWEVNGIRHIVGEEVMTREQEKALEETIRGITIPYRESKYWEKSDEEILNKPKV